MGPPVVAPRSTHTTQAHRCSTWAYCSATHGISDPCIGKWILKQGSPSIHLFRDYLLMPEQQQISQEHRLAHSRHPLFIRLCPTLCDPMDCSTPGLPVLHYLPGFTQTHDIESVMPSNLLILCQPFSSCPQSFPASEAFPMVLGSSIQVAKVLEPQLQHQSQRIKEMRFLALLELTENTNNQSEYVNMIRNNTERK